MNRHRSDRRGFTLVEVLLALTLTVMIVVVLYGVVYSTVDTRQRLAGFNEAGLIADRIADMIAEDLESIHIGVYDGGEAFVADSRGSDGYELSMISSAPQRMPDPDHDKQGVRGFREVQYVTVRSRERDGFLELWRREAPVDENAIKGGQFNLLHDQIERFEVRFLKDAKDLDWNAAEPGWELTKDSGLPAVAAIEVVVSIGTPPVDDSPEALKAARDYRRQAVRRWVALTPGMGKDTSKLVWLEPKDPKAKQKAGGAGPGQGTQGGTIPGLGGGPAGSVPAGNNPLLELIKRQQQGAR